MRGRKDYVRHEDQHMGTVSMRSIHIETARLIFVGVYALAFLTLKF